MDTKQIEYMIAVEKEGSITEAAKRLYVTPSALSQQLKNLEQELDTRLFIRSKRGMTLTPEGNLYLSGAKAMLAVKEKAMEQIQSLVRQKNQSSQISIALNQNFYNFVRKHIIAEFERKFPYMEIQTVLVTEKSAKEEVLRGNADMGFIIASGVTSSSLDSIPLQREAIHLAFPRQVLEELPADYSFEELTKVLRGMEYISAPRAQIRDADEYYLRCAGLDPKVLCYATSYAHLRKLLNLQFAYGVIPEGFIEETDTFAHVPIRPAAFYTLEIVLSSSLSMTEEIRELIVQFLREFDRENGGKSMLEALEHG
ncbi:MAG TPA: LysR family transcriptional regulator [Candidatus Lachnoclostridium pullistercoris]|uniref:LysR family transcriptional regulator n=1 Tax=Candidatus Lachnoclostridium pullistercoris TaxID=2838632 RepID=A0A9D2PBQ9_9FIRM|nr:LysR family transcriptional regulator [Candidatus Lachnoclostridium pullistercoris]